MEQVENKRGLQGAVEMALKKGTEKERIIAVLDCIRGYKNEYDESTEKEKSEGFKRCKNEMRNQINKIKDFVNSGISS
jgi:hypothetical protein